MPVQELHLMTIANLGRLLQTRQLSPMELTSTYLERVERLNPTLGAYITVMSETARAEAASAEDEIGQGLYRGPLHGIPVAIKDIIYTRSVLTSAGSRVLADHVPAFRLHDRRTSASFRGRAAGQAEPERVRDRRHD